MDSTIHERQIELLHEITRAMTHGLDIQASLKSILELLEKYLNMKRGTIALIDVDKDLLTVKVAHGISPENQLKGQYRVGEGISGSVFETGEAEIVPVISKDPRFLNRMGIRNETDMSFICVPIRSEKKVIGVLSVDMEYKTEARFNEEVRLLNIVSSMVGQKVYMHRLINAAQEKIIAENISLKGELKNRYKFANIIGSSKEMNSIYQLITQVAPTNANVLIRGESGTGKELIAHAIHYNSQRCDQPFVKINCSAFPETLLESELFGHEKGAFTGAMARKTGRFEWAHNGTLFLDEIGDISQAIQIKLLRAIQFKEFERIGGKETIKVNVRIIAATNKDLEKSLKDGSIREDFYYRINVFPIYMPPLRERKDDIIQLADYFLLKYSRENNKYINRISTAALEAFVSYHWPGNVRELENCIERAVVLCTQDESVILSKHLPPSLQMPVVPNNTKSLGAASMPVAVANLEREMIIESLKTHKGNQSKTAIDLGITERILGYKIKKYNIDPRIYSASVQKYTRI